MSTPNNTVKSEFGSKEALVDKLAPLLERAADESEADLRERLLHVSNAKLLRLWQRQQDLKGLGGRDKLADEVAKLAGSGKADADYRKRVGGFTTGRLLSLHRGLSKRSRASKTAS